MASFQIYCGGIQRRKHGNFSAVPILLEGSVVYKVKVKVYSLLIHVHFPQIFPMGANNSIVDCTYLTLSGDFLASCYLCQVFVSNRKS